QYIDLDAIICTTCGMEFDPETELDKLIPKLKVYYIKSLHEIPNEVYRGLLYNNDNKYSKVNPDKKYYDLVYDNDLPEDVDPNDPESIYIRAQNLDWNENFIRYNEMQGHRSMMVGDIIELVYSDHKELIMVKSVGFEHVQWEDDE
ncbi:MAG: YodL domain-containing protein, partial [Halanaerobiales bacterium]